MELEATVKFYDQFTHNYGVIDFSIVTLEDVIGAAKRNRKPVILNLHRETSRVSTYVCGILQNAAVFRSFNVLCWDIDCEDEYLRESLLETCRTLLPYDIVCRKIAQGDAAVFVFEIGGRVCLTNYFDDSAELQPLFELIETGTRIMEPVDSFAEFLEKNESCVQFFKESVQEAIDYARETDVLFLLYLHRKADEFSTQFCSMLTNKNVNEFFANFSVYAKDIDTENGVSWDEIKNAHPDLKECNTDEAGLFVFKVTNTRLIKVRSFASDVPSREDLFCALYNLQLQHEEEVDVSNVLIEKKAIISFINHFEQTHGLVQIPIIVTTLEKAIENLLMVETKCMQKILVLYYHNEDDPFSKEFMQFLVGNSFSHQLGTLETAFCFLPWNIADESYHAVLKKAVRNYFDLEIMEELIDKKQSAVFFFISSKNKPCLFTHTTGKYNKRLLRTIFQQLEESFQDSHDITEVVESESIVQFHKQHTLPTFLCNNMSLNDIFKDICLCNPVKSRKMLLLYFHNGEDDFCKNFSPLLAEDEEIQNVIKEYFHFLPWDVSDEKLHPKLLTAIRRYFNIEMMENLLLAKKAGIFLFTPIGQSLPLFSFIYKRTSRSNILKVLLKGKENLLEEQRIESMLENIESSGPVQFQQLVFNQLGDRDYDRFDLTASEEQLKQKIAFAFYGSPHLENEEVDTKDKKKKDKKRMETIDSTYEKIVKEAATYGLIETEIVMTCLFTCVTPLPKNKLKRLEKEPDYNPYIDFMIMPVFVLRKCTQSKSKKPCRIYIDHQLRSYSSWLDYLDNNKLPQGICIVPKNGKYGGDLWGNVLVEYRLTPACGLGSAVLKGIDIGTTVAGVGAGVIGAIAVIPAVALAPGIVIAATVIGTGAGIYSIARGSMKIYDRVTHNESMSVLNSEARGTYFQIVMGALGFTGSSLSAVTYFTPGANVGNVVRSSTLVFGGSAAVNSTFEVIYNIVTSETVDRSTLVQLSSSILFFGHSVYRIDENVTVTTKEVETLKQIQASLRSNRHRKHLKDSSQNKRHVSDETILDMRYLNDETRTLKILAKAVGQYGVAIEIEDDTIHFNGAEIKTSQVDDMSRMQLTNVIINMPSIAESTPAQLKAVQQLLAKHFESAAIANEIKTTLQDGKNQVFCANIVNVFSTFVQDKVILYLRKLLEHIHSDADLRLLLKILCVPSKQPLEILNCIISYFKSEIMEEEKTFVLQLNAETDLSQHFFNRKSVNRIIFFLENAILSSVMSFDWTMKKLVSYLQMWFIRKIYEHRLRVENNKVKLGQIDTYQKTRREECCKECDGVYYVNKT